MVRISASGTARACLRRYAFEGARRARRRFVYITQSPIVKAQMEMKATTLAVARPAIAPVERCLWLIDEGEGVAVLLRAGGSEDVGIGGIVPNCVGRAVTKGSSGVTESARESVLFVGAIRAKKMNVSSCAVELCLMESQNLSGSR